MSKLYIAGPMSGIPQFNYPAFLRAAGLLREMGYEVYCPAEMDSPEAQAAALASPTGSFDELESNGCDETWGDFLKNDVKLIADEVDAVTLLPGWETSRGARMEAFVALTCMKPVYLYTSEGPLYAEPSYIMDTIRDCVLQRDIEKEKRYG